MQDFWNENADKLLTILAAVGIFVAAWIVAVIVAAAIRAALKRTSLDEKVAGFLAGGGKPPALDMWISGAAKWLILLWGLMLSLDKLGLTAAVTPLGNMLSSVTSYLPKLGAAAGLAVIGWIVATGVRYLITRVLGGLGLDDRLNKAAGDEAKPVTVTKSIGTAAYWIVWLLFLLMILNALELHGLMTPLQGMANKVFAFLPNLFSAGIIFGVGWFAANIVRRIVSSVLNAVGIDNLAEKTGVSKSVGKGSFSGLLGTVAFLLILLPVISASLNALEMRSVSEPVQGMLDTFLGAIPKLLYAAVIVGVSWVIGRLIASLATEFLARIGFDNILGKLGLSNADPASLEESRRPSAVAGKLVMIAIMLFAAMEAMNQLGLENVSVLVHGFIFRAGGWVLGLVIFGLGLWIANLVAGLIRDRGTPNSGLLALVAKIAITVLAGIAALQEMQVAEETVQWAVIMAIAAIGLAFGLSFGLGCKQQASDQLDRWQKRLDNKND